MRGGNTREERAGWRKSARKSVKPASGSSEFGSRGRSRRQLLFQVSSLAAFAIGLIVILFIWLMRKPDLDVPLIVAAVTQSSNRNDIDPLFVPPNPLAYEDLELFSDWFAAADTNQHLRFVGNVADQSGPMEAVSNELQQKLTVRLAGVTPGGRGGNMIAMFVVAQGLVHNGQPFLLVGDSRPEDTTSWVSVESLLRGIANELKSHDHLDDCRVVLFLDANRAGAIWDWGKFDQSFTSRCRDVALRVAPEQIAVIVSGDEGERSWWDPRRGRSLFAHSIVQSLTGSGDLDGNGNVTVGEVAEFLRSQVSTEAQAIWAASQHPVLLSETAADWPFIRQPDQVAPPSLQEVDISGIKENYARMDRLWQRHNAVSQLPHPPLVTDPLAWSTLEKQLARLDQLAVAGEGYAAPFEQLITSCSKLLSRFENGSPLVPNERYLPEFRFVEYFHGETARSETEQEFADAWEKEPASDKAQFAPGFGSESQITGMLWDWLTKQQFDASSIMAAGSLIDHPTLTRNVPGKFLETRLLRLLSADDLPHLQDRRSTTILRSHVASRDTILTPDLRASFWIRGEAERLDLARMSHVDALLGPSDSAQAEEEISRLIRNDYSKLQETGGTISDAYRLRDRMLHQVPRMAETLLADGEAFAEEEQRGQSVDLIRDATREVRCLSARLRLADAADSPTAPDTIRDIADAASKARNVMQLLQGRLDERVDLVSRTQASDESGLRRAFALLQGSGISSAPQRKQIHDRLIEILGQTRSELIASSEERPRVVAPRSEDVSRWLLIGNEHPWVHWLNQTKELTCGPATNEKSATATDPTVAAGQLLASQGVEVRRSVGELLDGDFSKVRSRPTELNKSGESLAVVRQEVEDLETKLRSRTFLLSGRPTNVEEAIEDRFALDLRLFMMDHASRTLREFWCESRPDESPFFVQAAGDLLRFKPRPSRGTGFELGGVLDRINLNDRLTAAAAAVIDPATLTAQPTGEYARGALLKEVQGESVEFEFPRPDTLPPGRVSVWTETQSPLLPIADARSTPLATSLTVTNRLTKADDWFEVRSLYRGLRRRGRLTIRHLGDPQTVVFRLPEYKAPVALVQSQQTQAKIVLVLDCSGSMRAEDRMPEARKAVNELINALQIRGASVGLVLFGHRYGWEQTGPVDNPKLVRDEAGNFKVKAVRDRQILNNFKSLARLDDPAAHNPNFDVEIAVDLGSLDIDRMNRLQLALDDAYPVGVTPTYRAIEDAYKMLGDQAGQIIVLTDGEPFLAGESARRVKSRRPQAMEMYQTNSHVQLTIINFAEQVGNDLRDSFPLASHLSARRGQLRDVLRGAVDEISIAWKLDGQEVSRRVQPGQFVAIDPEYWPPRGSQSVAGQPVNPPQEYDIDAASRDGESGDTTQVEAQGGEAFQLRLDDDGLKHVPFRRDEHEWIELTREGSGGRPYSVLALAPDLFRNRQLTMRMVLENQEMEKWTPRPSDLWIELTGSDASGRRKARFTVNAAEYEPSQPVPVVLCRVDWPAWATSAVQVEAWLRFRDPTAPREKLPLDRPERFALPSVSGVTFLVTQSAEREYQVSVTEKHEPGQEINRVRMLLEPLPYEAVTRFYPKEGVVERVFRYQERPEELRAFVTTKNQITQGASIHVRGTAPPIRSR